MKLKYGITGLAPSEGSHRASIESGLIKPAMYEIQNTGLYKVLGFPDRTGSDNYYRISLMENRSGNTFEVLFNAWYPYYCGISSDSEWMNLKFVELPASVRNQLDLHFTYLTPNQLNSFITENDLSELSNGEREEVKKWKSKTFGEIIFNGYD